MLYWPQQALFVAELVHEVEEGVVSVELIVFTESEALFSKC